jgi:hypothetical protein
VAKGLRSPGAALERQAEITDEAGQVLPKARLQNTLSLPLNG